MDKNLTLLPQEDMDKINVDLAAAAVAFKERYRMPVIPEAVEREQPVHLRGWFRNRLMVHRLKSTNLSRLPYKSKVRKCVGSNHYFVMTPDPILEKEKMCAPLHAKEYLAVLAYDGIFERSGVSN